MEKLQVDDSAAYDEMMLSRATPWGGEPPQPLDCCVRHLLSIIIAVIERSSGNAVRSSNDGVLQKSEVKKFWRDVGGEKLS